MFAIFFLGFFIAGLVRMFNATRMPFGMLRTGQAALGTLGQGRDTNEAPMWFTCFS